MDSNTRYLLQAKGIILHYHRLTTGKLILYTPAHAVLDLHHNCFQPKLIGGKGAQETKNVFAAHFAQQKSIYGDQV